MDPEAAEAKNQEIVQALGAVAAAGAGALVVAGVVEAEAALATGTAAAAVLGTVVSSAVAAKQAADDDEGEGNMGRRVGSHMVAVPRHVVASDNAASGPGAGTASDSTYARSSTGK